MSDKWPRYRLFCVCPRTTRKVTPRWFLGKQTDPYGFGLSRWGFVIYAFGRALAMGLERNDGPFVMVGRIDAV